MTIVWGILIGAASGSVCFYAGARFVGANLAKILAKFDNAQLAKLADEVSRERRRGRTS